MRSPTATMSSPHAFPNGRGPRRGTRSKNTRHADLITRLGSWLVNAATPRLIADQLIAPIRPRTQQSDDRLKRAARRLINRPPANPDKHTR
jgi:hypothetical protein